MLKIVYDSRGDQTAENIRDPNGTLQQAVTRSYDFRSRLDKLNLGTFGGCGAQTDYDFEAAGNLKQVFSSTPGCSDRCSASYWASYCFVVDLPELLGPLALRKSLRRQVSRLLLH